MKSRLIMIKYNVQWSSFILGTVVLKCHLPSGRPGTCPGCTCPVLPWGDPPVRPAGGHPVHAECPCPVEVEGTRPCGRRTVGWPGWARRASFPIRTSSSISFSDLPKLSERLLSFILDYLLKIYTWICKTLISL